MIKQTWNISEEEKFRILNLHESATKNLYLLNEQVQGGQENEKSWSLCQTLISQSGDKFYAQLGDGQTIEIPKLSQVSGTIQGGQLILSQITQNGLEVGKMMKETMECSNKFPMTYQGNYSWFCYFDDISSKLIGNKGTTEKLVKRNTPVYGILSVDGSLGTGGMDFMDQKPEKDKNGTTIQFGVNRTKSYILEISPAMEGEGYTKEVVKPKPPKETPSDEVIELNIESPFVFDKTDLTPEAETQFRAFIEKLKKDYQGVPANVEVVTSASIDAEPSSKEKYNMDLSTRRANAIIERLKSELGQTKLNFVPKPIGQTDKFSPGLKWPEVKDSNRTAPNRRLIIKLPKLIIKHG